MSSESWDELLARCQANVNKIRETKDDGVYAQLYAADVSQLIELVRSLDAATGYDGEKWIP